MKDCCNCKFELYEADEIPCKDCGIDDREYWQPKPKTNADRIRAMSDEELSVFLWEFDKEEIARTTENVLERRKITEWLKHPAE